METKDSIFIRLRLRGIPDSGDASLGANTLKESIMSKQQKRMIRFMRRHNCTAVWLKKSGWVYMSEIYRDAWRAKVACKKLHI